MKSIAPALTSLLVLTACGTAHNDYKDYLARKNLTNQTPERFTHCHGYGCQSRTAIELNEKEWRDIVKPMTEPSKSAAEEQTRIKTTIANFENAIGALAGTGEDIRGTFKKTGTYQLDCVDESTNTTVYLSLLEQHGLLKHHAIMSPTSRMPIINAGRWPHQTAVIRENTNGKNYVVDSWFHNNGIPPEIIPLETWKKGWKPEK